ALAFAPLLGPVGVADCHPHDRDRGMHAAERSHARNPPAGANDDLAADLLTENAIRRADVAATLRCDRGRLQAQSVLPDRGGRLVHDAVVRLPASFEREIEAWEVE